MSSSFTGFFFDSETLRSRSVELQVVAGRLQLIGLEPPQDFSLADVRVSDRLAGVPRFLYLPDRKTVETHDQDAADRLAALQRRGRFAAVIHWLEDRSRVAAAAALMLAASVLAVVYFGLPALAKRTAYAIPDSLEQQAGRAGLATVNRVLGPSKLSKVERAQIQSLLDDLVRQQKTIHHPRIEFRSMGDKSPNAFALPGGIILVSDEIVNLAENDAEITAVLAHELGHVERRHGLQTILRGSAALLVVSALTGDLSTLTSFSGTMPFVLLQRGYSREFEREADDYAIMALRTAHVDPEAFVSILGRLEKVHTGESGEFSYLGTHPSTEDRIRRITAKGAPALAAVKVMGALPDGDDTFPGDEVISSKGRSYRAPRALAQPSPAYPLEMSAANLEGRVTLEFIINKKGNVRDVRVVQSTYKEFEGPAIAAVKQWKFAPSRLRGHPVSTRAAQVLEFNLHDSPATSTSVELLPIEEVPPNP